MRFRSLTTIVVTLSLAALAMAGGIVPSRAAAADLKYFASLSGSQVTGITVVGETLTIQSGAWEPEPESISFQWLRSGVPVPGATGRTYVLTGLDVGRSIAVDVSASKPGYATAVTRSYPSGVIRSSPSPFLQVPKPLVFGRAFVGDTLAWNGGGSWVPAADVQTYQWNRDGVPIENATDRFYELVEADAGAAITLTLTGSKPGYLTTSSTSAPTAPVVALPLFDVAPVPVIEGWPYVGETLSFTREGWQPDPTSFGMQWYRDGVPITGSWEYELVDADVGHTISVAVTAMRSGYRNHTVWSAPTDTIKALEPFVDTPVPFITGVPTVHEQLSVTAGEWAPAPDRLTYQWLRDGAPIHGATASAYTLVDADGGAVISVTATAAKRGYVSESRSSKPTAVVTPMELFAATPGLPLISGVPKAGSTLSVVTGYWGTTPTFMYQWFRDGMPVEGATQATYALDSADEGRRLRVAVTGLKSGYRTETRTSSETEPVLPELTPFASTSAPEIMGAPAVGERLSALITSAWQPEPVEYSTHWFRNGEPIEGAIGGDYTLGEADEGQVITVVLTGTKTGYAPTSRSSADFGPVGPPLVERLAGDDRFETSARISAENYEPGVAVAYVANAMNFPDALSGAPVAGAKGGPVLLVPGDWIPQVVQDELGRLRPQRIVVLGGAPSVSSAVESQLSHWAEQGVDRVAGIDRFDTSAQLSAKTFVDGADVVYVANGMNFPDALSGAPVAGGSPGPVLLVPGDRITPTVSDELERLHPQRIVILGGTPSVSNAVESQLAGIAAEGTERWYGADRFETSAKISRESFEPGVPVAYISSGMSFPDALSGAPVASRERGPVLLVPNTWITPSVRSELERLNPQRIVVLGGTPSVSADVEAELSSYLG